VINFLDIVKKSTLSKLLFVGTYYMKNKVIKHKTYLIWNYFRNDIIKYNKKVLPINTIKKLNLFIFETIE
jgi:hypothetical protein